MIDDLAHQALVAPRVEGTGPEQVQSRKAIAAIASTLWASVARVAIQDPAASRFVSADIPSPQLARRTVTSATLVRGDSTGRDSRPTYLPLRLTPASWDGEPGYTMPHEQA